MCIIIDANCMGKITTGSRDALPVVKWLKSPDGHLAMGGSRMGKEYKTSNKWLNFLTELARLGKIKRYDQNSIDSRETELMRSGQLHSNDAHVLSLALISGARVLFSEDGDLHQDFVDINIVRPRGHVYQNITHSHLLRQAPSCS